MKSMVTNKIKLKGHWNGKWQPQGRKGKETNQENSVSCVATQRTEREKCVSVAWAEGLAHQRTDVCLLQQSKKGRSEGKSQAQWQQKEKKGTTARKLLCDRRQPTRISTFTIHVIYN